MGRTTFGNISQDSLSFSITYYASQTFTGRRSEPAIHSSGSCERYGVAPELWESSDGQSCLNLAAARLRYIAGSAWSTKRYMNMRPLYQPQVVQTGAVA